jgi:hypothetical protein
MCGTLPCHPTHPLSLDTNYALKLHLPDTYPDPIPSRPVPPGYTSREVFALFDSEGKGVIDVGMLQQGAKEAGYVSCCDLDPLLWDIVHQSHPGPFQSCVRYP